MQFWRPCCHVHHLALTLAPPPFSLKEGPFLGRFMSAIGHQTMQMRQCAFCGKRIAAHLNQCPFCREMQPLQPQVRLSRTSGGAGGRQTRRGLLYMLLAGGIYYFAARSEEHTSELQSQSNIVCRLLLEKKTNTIVSRLDI